MAEKKSVAYKLDEETIAILKTLAAHLGLSQASILAIALRLLARREGLEIPGDLARGFDGSLYIPSDLKKRT
jgi:hypothetical protein